MVVTSLYLLFAQIFKTTKTSEHNRIQRLLFTGPHGMASDGVLPRFGIRHHRSAQTTAEGRGNCRDLRRRTAGPELPPRFRQNSSGREGGQHTAD